ncbi:MAG: hydrogenase formation protein HypD [Oscillospiraceae bacterium]|jgi:hydrogenase expression/formation protein HypD|nr:hydrogenase formation protein HypD [Oscillospiraceae bacterium]
MEILIKKLKEYKKNIKIMEVCGTHTSVIHKNGIRDLISKNIQLVSGPGCPVCVTKAGYVDRLVQLSEEYTILTFGDMVKVRGSEKSLENVKNKIILYNPLEAVAIARENPDKKYCFAAVGFETTLPIYALILEDCPKNLKLLTSLKAIIPAVEYICNTDNEINAFLAPGNVCAIIGSKPFEYIVKKYKKPIIVTGFTPEHILMSIYSALKMVENADFTVKNLYKNIVKENGNEKALALINKHFTLTNDWWRGLGIIENSAYTFDNEYIPDTEEKSRGCCCAEIILGKKMPKDCPLFKKTCTPFNPIGACMVGNEGVCKIMYS